MVFDARSHVGPSSTFGSLVDASNDSSSVRPRPLADSWRTSTGFKEQETRQWSNLDPAWTATVFRSIDRPLPPWVSSRSGRESSASRTALRSRPGTFPFRVRFRRRVRPTTPSTGGFCSGKPSTETFTRVRKTSFPTVKTPVVECPADDGLHSCFRIYTPVLPPRRSVRPRTALEPVQTPDRRSQVFEREPVDPGVF